MACSCFREDIRLEHNTFAQIIFTSKLINDKLQIIWNTAEHHSQIMRYLFSYKFLYFRFRRYGKVWVEGGRCESVIAQLLMRGTEKV